MGKLKQIIGPISLCLLVFILFGGVLRHNFNSDDYLVVYHALSDPASSPEGVIAEFANPSWGLYYRPLIKFFFEAVAGLFGVRPWGYHLLSVICYALLCLEVYVIALLLAGKRHVSTAAALIFMASNSHGEALFWISSLNGVVENIISLAALALFILWRKREAKKLYALSLALFAAALLTKESAISLVIILALYDFLLGGEAGCGTGWIKSMQRAALSCWPFAAVGVLFILVRALVMSRANMPPPLVSFTWSVLLSGPWRSFVMTLSPFDWWRSLHLFETLAGTGAASYAVMAAAMSALTIVPLALRRCKAAFLLLWIPAAAAPLFALGLVPAERHVVISSVGAALFLAILFFRLSERITRRSPKFAVALGFGFVLAFTIPSLSALKQRQEAWARASFIASDVVEQTMLAHPAPAEDTTFFFVNVPDSIDGAFVFRFDNLNAALRLYYGDESIKAVRIAALDTIPPIFLRSGRREAVYLKIDAMGGNVYVPEEKVEGPGQSPLWRELEQLGFMGKNFRYIDNWGRYESSPFLVYSRDGLIRLPPAELKKVVGSLYSLR